MATKTYLKPGEKPPKGRPVYKGKQGGMFYFESAKPKQSAQPKGGRTDRVAKSEKTFNEYQKANQKGMEGNQPEKPKRESEFTPAQIKEGQRRAPYDFAPKIREAAEAGKSAKEIAKEMNLDEGAVNQFLGTPPVQPKKSSALQKIHERHKAKKAPEGKAEPEAQKNEDIIDSDMRDGKLYLYHKDGKVTWTPLNQKGNPTGAERTLKKKTGEHMSEEAKAKLPPPKEAEIKLPDEQAKEAQLQEAPPEAAPAEAAPTENPEEFDAKKEVEALKDAIGELAEQVSEMKEAWDKLAEEEAEEPAHEGGAPEAPAPEPAAPAEAEKPEVAMHSKELSDIRTEVAGLRAELAKFASQGIRKTVQSSASRSADPMEAEAEKQLGRMKI